MKTLLVVVDRGSVSPRDIVLSLAGHFDLVFAVPERSPYATTVAPLFAAAGRLEFLGTDTSADVARLRALRPDGVVTFSESTVRVTATIATHLGLRTHDPATVLRLTDKSVQRQRLREAGVDDTPAWLLDAGGARPALPRSVPYPAVIKPAVGEGSRNTYLAGTPEEAAELVTRLLRPGGEPRLLVEQFLTGERCDPYGDYVSVESVCDGDRIVHLGVTGKMPQLPPFRETGQFWPAVLAPPARQQVEDLTSRALRALGVTCGLTHTEVKLTPRGPRIIEVNGRIGGYINELYGRILGTDLVRLAADLACGQPYQLPAPAAGAVLFQYYNQPPQGATTLAAVTGTSTVRSHPAISSYSQFVTPGQALPNDHRTFTLDLLCGRAPSHPAMLSVLQECLDALSFTFQADGVPVTFTGTQLRGAVPIDAGP